VVTQVVRQSGVAAVYVSCNVTASSIVTVSVSPYRSALDVPSGSVAGLRLDPPSPNPFLPSAGSLTLRFALPAPERVSVRVYDLAGRQVAELFDGQAAAGEHVLTWDGRGARGGRAEAGVYLVRLVASAGERRVKVAVLR
jgi:hypothetical protein